MGESSTLSERATVTEGSFADRWLLERYFWFAGSILVWSLPLALMWQRADDMRGLGVYVVLTVVAWLGARANRLWAVRGHLFALFPYWAWYASLPEGTPHLLSGGGAGFAVMLVFPLLVLIALDGALAGGVAFLIGALGSSFAYEKMTDRLVGVFVLGVGFLVGLVFRRLVKELESARLDLTQRSTTDPLTGLLNRAAFGERKTEEPRGALLFIDLDRFKTVNDVFGHAAGDQLLRMAAQRIVEAVPAEAVVYRLGGDEFAVVAPSRSADDGVRIASTVVASIEAPFEVGGGFVHVGATVGIALWPQHGAFMTKLLGVADNAMFKAKKTSRRILVQDSSEGDSLAVRALEVELRQAIKQKQLVPHLQAVVDLRTDRVVGAEVLVRWAHPERGLIAPAAFIDLAEETGQIVEIDRFVLGFAAQYVADLAAKGQDIWLAVNASARTLDDEDFLKDLEAIAQKNLARKLVIEITESATMRDPERSVSVLQRMCKWGFQVAIDDFGMGYSSLAYLRKLPASHLKIDRTFTAGIGRYPRDEDVVELVLQLAKKFELEVVAEGVETNEQRVWLRERGCRFVQGFGIARPCPVNQFVLESRNSGVGLVEPSSSDFSLVDSGEIPAASGRKLRRVPT